MVNIVRHKHRLAGGGGTGSPTAAGQSGEISINFDVGAGTPELWSYDGAAWKRINPASAITTATSAQLITGTATGAYPDPAALAGAAVNGTSAGAADAGKYVRLDANGFLTPAILGTNAVATSAGAADAGKIVKLDAAGKIDASFQDLATAAEIAAGTANAGVVSADLLAAASVKTFGSVADDGKYVRVTTTGKIDPSLLPASAMEFKGSTAATAAAPGTPDVGDVYIVSTAGVFPASWTGIATQAGAVGDQLIWDGAAWQLIRKDADLTAYVPLAGTAGVTGAAMTSGAVITFNPAASGNNVLNGATGTNFGAMDKFIIDCGTF